VIPVDAISDLICGWMTDQRDQPVSGSALREATRRVLDSLGCAVGAVDSQPAAVARSLARDVTSSQPASVIGAAAPTSMELAAFANTVMVRYLDGNDTYFTARGGGGHPSDVIPTALAVGQATGASGYDVLRAIVHGYEIIGALANGVWLRERGWDQGLNVVAATSMMAGELLGLSFDELRHALALAVTPHVPVRQTRIGHLSMWKGSATAGAARNGIFSAQLAQRGMTGPPEPFTGRSGIWDLVTGPFEISLPVSPGRSVVEDSSIKMRPAEYNAQAALDLVFGLRASTAPDNIGSIDISTYWLAWHEIGHDPAKWAPRNRETADHSLPYLVAVAWLDGHIDADSCSPGRIADPRLAPLMRKVTVTERPEFTQRFPAEFNVEIAVTLRTGERIVRRAAFPHGHPQRPASDAELGAKFDALVASRTDADRELCALARGRVTGLASAPSVAGLLEPLTKLATADQATLAGGSR
jgi:2-methylcitrate dehydratase